MDFDFDGEKGTGDSGDAGVILGNTPHETHFPVETEVIDVFTPLREDTFTGLDTYLRRG